MAFMVYSSSDSLDRLDTASVAPYDLGKTIFRDLEPQHRGGAPAP